MSAEFDAVADDYDAQLQKGIAITGESKDYFAEERLKWLRRRLVERGFQARSALDFGCGTGSATPFFFQHLAIETLTGVDPSEESLRVASAHHGKNFAVRFLRSGDPLPEPVDLAFCNGVFHHIPPGERDAAVEWISQALRPGGYFGFWENNPWNPLMRYSMSRVSFDADAVMVWPGEARRLLRRQGLRPVSTDFRFYFPKLLAPLRVLDGCLLKVPLGAQYLVLAQKSAR